MAVIALTTDFGYADWFAGTLRGVILALAPRATVVDLTHGLRAGDIRAGAFALAASCRFYPRGTIHVVVVDPGVGSQRRPIAVQTDDYFFLGPDNGVLSWALRQQTVKAMQALENQDYFLRPISRTFHGRDIFASAAAHLARGVPIKEMGPRLKQIVHLSWPEPTQTAGSIRGQVVYIDQFGNAITNIEAALLRSLGARRLQFCWRRNQCCRVADFYQAVPAGTPVAVCGSSGFLELAINAGNAAAELRLKVGSPVIVSRRAER